MNASVHDHMPIKKEKRDHFLLDHLSTNYKATLTSYWHDTSIEIHGQ